MLSKRLKKIADLVSTKSIIDVGCDHALLCIYLTGKGIKCLGTDISDKVLMGAKVNLKKYSMEDKIVLVKTNGLENISVNDNDTIVIAGMGTNTILNILAPFKGYNPLIICSNNDLFRLRKSIIKKGYVITNEEVVLERKHYYVIIKFEQGKRRYHYFDYLLGPISSKNKEYMSYLLEKYEQILANLPKKYIIKRIITNRCIHKIKKLIT